MLHPMFGMGGSEILVILVIALIFLGPDKLPDAAKTISKGIRDLKKQTRVLQQTIEDDEHIGGAIRDLKSALRGDEIPVRPKKPKPAKQLEAKAEPKAELASAEAPAPEAEAEAKPALTLPPTAGERDAEPPADDGVDELAAMIKPAAGTVGRSEAEPATAEPASAPKQKHG
jgi:sec-independent protein translocase protein TatB